MAETPGESITKSLASVKYYMWSADWPDLLSQSIDQAIKEAVEAEREACATVALHNFDDRIMSESFAQNMPRIARELAAAIRARTCG